MAKKKIDSADDEPKKKNTDIFSYLAKATNAEVLSNTTQVKYFIDTGNLAFNWACSGVFMGGGIPGGRITEFYGPEGSGKCIHEDMQVLLSDGRLERIKDVVASKEKTKIVSLNEDTQKFEAFDVSEFWNNGKKECLEVRTRTGREVTTTENHQYLTPDGWKYLKDVKVGDYIAVPKKLDFFGTIEMNRNELKYLAYMMAEGCSVACLKKGKKHGYASNFTNNDSTIIKDFEQCCDELNINYYRKQITNFLSGEAKPILRKFGLIGCSAKTKQIPKEVFSCPKEQIAEFLRIFFSCDGYINNENNNIELTLANRKLIYQISHLLLRFGIVHSVKYKIATCKGKKFDSWRLNVGSEEYRDLFIKEINFISVKRKLAKTKIAVGMSYLDKFPHQVADRFYNEADITSGDRASSIRIQIKKKCPLMRMSFNHLESSVYEKYMESNILWDEVISINPVGECNTYDLGVKTHHNFVANDCVVHNSYWGTNIVRGCQAIGGIPVYLDCENSLNNEWIVKTSHIDLDRVLVFDPSTGVDSLEGCFDKIYSTIRHLREKDPTTPIVFIYDSLSASPSSDELADTQKDWNPEKKEQPGVRARICSREFRKLNTLMEKTNSTLLVLNQTRLKIGVMYGCFFYCSKVLLSDGSWMKIGKIVNNKLPVEVMSYNVKTGKVEPKKVIGWHKNGKVDNYGDFIKIKFKRRFNNAFGSMMVTPNHKIFKKDEFGHVVEVEAGNIQVGDTLAAVQPHYLSDEQMQFVYGSVLGDGCLERKEQGRNAHLEFGHGAKQIDYLNFKIEAFAGLHGSHYVRSSDGAAYVTTTSLYELERLCNYKIGIGKLRIYNIPQEIIDNLDELGLAIWYLDDGTYGGYHKKYGNGKSVIYCKKFKDKHRMLPVFRDRFGLNPTVSETGFVFNSENTFKLHQLICRFVHPSMKYKIHPKFHGLFDYKHKGNNFRYEVIDNKVLDIKKFNHRDQPFKFDLTVEDNATYVVGGAIVHNSPIVSAGGGESLKFYASLRVCTSVQKKIDNKKLNTPMGINLKVRNIKNRCTSPFLEAEGVQLYWKDGVNPLSGLLTALIQSGRIDKAGNGTYQVKEPWAAGVEIKFRASKARNDIDIDTLLRCPALVDAKDEQELKDYISIFGAAISQSENEDNEETDTKGLMDDDYEG